MKSFKKAVVSCALLVTMIAPSRAAIGVGFAAPLAVVAGVAAMGVSAVGAYGGYRLIKKGSTATTVAGVGVILLSAAGAYFGLIILDGEQKAEFSELSTETALDLNISENEREIYNSEVEQVNAIAREIGSELAKQGSESAELARDMWIELGTELSPETMKTVIAIAQQG